VLAYAYILQCRDGSYYVGSARDSLERRVNEHQGGFYDGYTSKRLPVKLVWSQEFQQVTDAIAAERQIKGWSRAKKQALINGDFDLIKQLAKRRQPFSSSFETAASQPPQDEENGCDANGARGN
jgi:predicted GIY-YIG superfamily endonuclease